MKKSLLLVSVILLLGSISCQLINPSPATETGALDLTILYTGQWYRDTFNYQPDAPNIRHIALILPTDITFEKEAGWVFTSLGFTPTPEPFELRENASVYEPMLAYLYDVPQGKAAIELSPGTYRLAVAFIAAALPPPDGDPTLYPGVTGGGASNEFQEIVIETGKTLTVTLELSDDNGWGYVRELVLK